MTKKGSIFCDYCERAYMPEDSTAETPQRYCSQVCEISDGQIEDSDEEL